MARGINKVMLLGHLGSDPERRETTTGKSVVNFSLATSETYKDANDVKQEKTEWHRIVVWGKLADICSQYLRKGALIYLEGKLQTRSWEQDGVKKYSTEINASEMQMLDRKPTDADTEPERRTYKAGDPIPADVDKDDLPF